MGCGFLIFLQVLEQTLSRGWFYPEMQFLLEPRVLFLAYLQLVSLLRYPKSYYLLTYYETSLREPFDVIGVYHRYPGTGGRYLKYSYWANLL